jgi:photosystem II stability/assembly factor-like uncharacterized protein
MKYLIQTSFMCMLLASLIFPQPWQLQTSNMPANATAHPFYPVDDNVCWALWTTSNSGTGEYINGYLRTTDGGSTWESDSIPGTLNGSTWWIDALDANTAYAAIESWAGWGMQGIYKTTDGGATWEKNPTLYENSDYGPAYIHFFDINNGVTIGERDPNTLRLEIYTTTNGGIDWVRVPDSNIPPNNSTEFLDPVEVSEIGDYLWIPTVSLSGPRFYKTTDKGYTWSIIDVPNTNQDYEMFPAFKDTLNGIRVFWKWAAPYYSLLEKTTDGGITWTEIPGPFGDCVPLNVCYVPGTSDGYVITGDINVNGYAGGSAYTLDGGSTWTNLDNSNYCYMTFNSDQVGWATCWTTNNFYKYVGPPMPIPVELTSFTASVSGNDVNLNWATSTETNNKGFEVQRSAVGGQPAGGGVSPKSGKSGWEKIGFVEGKGTTTNDQQYTFTDKEVPAGNYAYRLKQIDLSGAFSYSEEINVEVKSVYTYYLSQNYPNPFNPTTSIKFGINKKSNVRIDIFNSIGETVKTILNEEREPGNYTIDFNAVDLPSGVYIYRIESGSFAQTRKTVLLK